MKVIEGAGPLSLIKTIITWPSDCLPPCLSLPNQLLSDSICRSSPNYGQRNHFCLILWSLATQMRCK